MPVDSRLSLMTDEADAFSSKKDDLPDTRKKSASQREKDLLEEALKRFKVAADAEGAQRRREQEDLQFDRAFPEDQWPKDILADRAGGIGPDGFQVNARPCLVIPKLDQPVQQVVNEARNARIGVHIKPKGDGASQDDAELRQGLYRTIEMNSRAQVARLWALERAVKCGRGAYRISKIYANDGDFDIDLVIERILNQASVYLDPFAKEPDWSDGEWAIITSDIPIDEYKRRYPKSALADASAEQFQSIGDKAPGWVGGSEADGTRTVRVAEYFYVEHQDKILVFVNGEKLFQDELPPGFQLPPGTPTRKVDHRNVKWALINAEEVIEEEDWQGRYIPIVPVIGKEYNVDGDRSFKGVVSNSKDAQRSYNYMRSAQVEAVGLAPKAPWIMAEGQDEGYETMWDQSNTRNYTRLKYKPTDFNGKPLPPPQRNVAEPAIQAISMAVNMADTDIKSTTGRFDPSLGRSRPDQSGKAILALKESGEATTSNYLENLTYIAMHYEAQVILDLMPYVYDRPGRILRVLGEEEHEDKAVMINQPFVRDPNGQPMPAPPPGMMQRLGQAFGMPPTPPKMYDLKKGQYSVEITVGKSFATQREENQDMLRAIIESAPGLTPVLADLLVEQIDTPIARRAAKRLRKMNPAAKEDEEGQPPIPPEVQAQLKQMEEQNQQLTEALKQQTEELKANRYKVDAEVRISEMEIASRERIAGLTTQTQVQTTGAKVQGSQTVAEIQAEADLEEARLKAAVDRQARQEDGADKRQMAAAEMYREDRGRDHEWRMKEADEMRSTRERRETLAHDKEMMQTKARTDLVSGALKDRRAQQFDYAQKEMDRNESRMEGVRTRRHQSAEAASSRRQEIRRERVKARLQGPKPTSKEA